MIQIPTPTAPTGPIKKNKSSCVFYHIYGILINSNETTKVHCIFIPTLWTLGFFSRCKIFAVGLFFFYSWSFNFSNLGNCYTVTYRNKLDFRIPQSFIFADFCLSAKTANTLHRENNPEYSMHTVRFSRINKEKITIFQGGASKNSGGTNFCMAASLFGRNKGLRTRIHTIRFSQSWWGEPSYSKGQCCFRGSPHKRI